ncbi:hypothetical protein [Lactococcus allomyrinae]|uniref:Uncharacterized protein n=1 Tax=Lactococcus allomyrinae TaxID=2419773 RepID=A0A387BH03_9LACT|nr:hypothetical protein [Lactococcus allomyrinae]AYG00406.1 hypothetical protein D7I46_04450 [Lactococcus allomyrinae]
MKELKISHIKLSTELGITAVKLSDQLSTRVDIEEDTIQNILNVLGIDMISEDKTGEDEQIKVNLNKTQTRALLYFIRGLIRERG